MISCYAETEVVLKRSDSERLRILTPVTASEWPPKLQRSSPDMNHSLMVVSRLKDVRKVENFELENVWSLGSLPASENVLLVDVNASHKIVVTFQL